MDRRAQLPPRVELRDAPSGPEAHQLAIYVGWLLNGSPGAIVAGVFFLLPAFFLIVALSWTYAVHGDVAWIAGVFDGFAWAVVAIVAAAMLRIAARSLSRRSLVLIAVFAFLALYLVGVPFPLVVIGAGLVGLLARDLVTSQSDPAGASEHPERVRPTIARTVRVLALGLTVWLLPLLAVAAAAGFDSVLAEEALFFSILALVTFGGAYAALAYVNQAAVIRFSWLTADEMAVGLSLAETTPGPLILVVCFVASRSWAPSGTPPASRRPRRVSSARRWPRGRRSSRASSGSSSAPPRSNACAGTGGSGRRSPRSRRPSSG